MCQINAVLSQEGKEKNIMENVTQLEVTSEGVLLSSFFEEPKLLRNYQVKNIDFLKGKLTLEPHFFGEAVK